MEDSTAAEAVTLRRLLKKKLTEIFDDGDVGGESEDRSEGSRNGALAAIDESIKILNSLRIIESKNPVSDIPSPSASASVKVPKEFICSLSKNIMIDPVTIASGETYEKKYITEWMRRERTCPKSNEVLSNSLCTSNRLVNKLIAQWCEQNNFDRSLPSDELAIELFTDDIDSLLQQISSSSSVEDQIEAATEIRFRTKKFANVRLFFVEQVPDSINRLLTPLGDVVNSNPELQEQIITILFNISVLEKNKTVVAENPNVIPVLVKSMKHGTDETRRNSAGTLLSLSVIDSNKVIIGNSEALEALIYVISNDADYLAIKEAASAMFNLFMLTENREKAILAGLVPVMTSKIEAGSLVEELVTVLAFLSRQKQAIEEMENLGFISVLFKILRNQSDSVTGENAVVIVFNMCETSRRMSILKKVVEEEEKFGTFKKLAEQGTDRAVRKTEVILRWIKRFVSGKGILIV